MNDLHYGLIGLGPIGSSIAAHLLSAGQRVSALCIEPEKFKAMTEFPIQVTGALNATGKMSALFEDLKGFLSVKPDVILIAIKSCDTPTLLDEIKKLGVASDTIYVSCQNGLDVERYYVERFGWGQTLRMVLHIGATMTSPHSVHVAFSHTHFLSDHAKGPKEAGRHIAEHLNKAGFVTCLTPNYQVEVFKKAILNSTLGAVCAVTGYTMKRTIEDPLLRPLVEKMIQESVAVAQAAGLDIPSSFSREALQYMALGGEHKPSILVDVEQGRKTENEDHCGRIHYYAKKHGIADPVLESFYTLVKKAEERSGLKKT